MSNATNADSARSHTLLSNLRHFRFQKKSAAALNNSEPQNIAKTTGVEGKVFRRRNEKDILVKHRDCIRLILSILFFFTCIFIVFRIWADYKSNLILIVIFF